jgi:putative Ca2+/H+ antiporter (TMEM165/GDT1 family)
LKLDFQLAVFWAAFLAAFFAELNCLARTATLVTRFGSPLSVCLGTLLGNALLLLPIFLGGEWLHKSFPELPVRIISALLFILMGVLMLFHRHH